MQTIIKKSFKNSKFFENYKNIDGVLFIFQEIKNNYKNSKMKYNLFLSKMPLKNDQKTDENNSQKIILNEMIKINHNIKKYINYTNSIMFYSKKIFEKCYIKNVKIITKFIEFERYFFYICCIYSNLKIFKFLIKIFKNWVKMDELLLVTSAWYGKIDIVKFLIEKGTNINTRNDYLIKWYNYNENTEMVNFLIKMGANGDVIKNSKSKNPMEKLKYWIEWDYDIYNDVDLLL